jgi:hypothetical protein
MKSFRYETGFVSMKSMNNPRSSVLIRVIRVLFNNGTRIYTDATDLRGLEPDIKPLNSFKVYPLRALVKTLGAPLWLIKIRKSSTFYNLFPHRDIRMHHFNKI